LFTRALQWSLSSARLIQSIPPNPVSPRSTLIVPSHLRLALSYGLFPFVFPTNNVYTFLFSPIRATCLAHHILLDLFIQIIFSEEYKSRSSPRCSFLQPPVTLSLFGLNILLSTLFTNTLSLCSSLNVSQQTTDYRQNCSLASSNFFVFRKQTRR
jgi:hypothetical protein